ncbi:protocatechuate 3,4-dioxygenase subunit alpha [Tepidamorphus sp. 3E244]|uniref:protocatechuate 3,4-dioxygenase subunit alpha n=1 Tax=Tepidamorphus sp. 3E244 TaxID=3385498 RepID=UPI0038FCDA57
MAGPLLKETPSQTAGPYVHIGMLPSVAGLSMRTQEKPWITALAGDTIALEGTIYDGDGEPVRDAVLELWQADSSGNFDDSQAGFARAACDLKSGLYRFETVKPGGFALPDGRMQAPHITLLIFARGINLHLHTRLYFSDETEANAEDPVLKILPSQAARDSLIACVDPQTDERRYHFDMVLQGERETAFFDV